MSNEADVLVELNTSIFGDMTSNYFDVPVSIFDNFTMHELPSFIAFLCICKNDLVPIKSRDTSFNEIKLAVSRMFGEKVDISNAIYVLIEKGLVKKVCDGYRVDIEGR